jgi:hypothetical protein
MVPISVILISFIKKIYNNCNNHSNNNKLKKKINSKN